MIRVLLILLFALLSGRAADVVVGNLSQPITWLAGGGNNYVAQFGTGAPPQVITSALYFNFSNKQYVQTASNYTNDIFGSTNTCYSILAWTKLINPSDGHIYVAVATKNPGPDHTAWYFGFCYGWEIDSEIVDDNANWLHSSIATPQDNAWHLIGMVKSNNIVTMNIDGTNASPLTMTAVVPFPSGPLYIGNEFDTDRAWSGCITEVLLYNRVLSAAEIQTQYNAGTGIKTYPTNGLINHWACDEGSGTNVADSTGNAPAWLGPGTRAPAWTNW
jgi:hypothetical protein